MIDERTEELAAAYVLGALEPEEERLLERQLQSDAELRRLVAQLREVGALLGGQSPSLEPSAGLKARLLLELEEHAPASPAPPRATPRAPAPRAYPAALPWALAAGLAALSLLFGWQAHSLRGQLEAREHRLQELSQIAATLRADGEDLRHTVATLEQSNRLANMRIAVLSSQLRADPHAVAVSVWDNERQRGVMVVHHLKPPPQGKDYQLWIIDPRYATPVDAGVFKVDAAGDGRADFSAQRPIKSANQFAVTLEAAGGSPVPTPNSMVLAGA